MHRVVVSSSISLPYTNNKPRHDKGGSRFAAYYNYDDLVESECTTVELQADKSNYWMVSSAPNWPVNQSINLGINP